MSSPTAARMKANIASAYASRPSVPLAEPAPEPVARGLELSEVFYRPLSFFRLNPANEIFRAMKSAQYMADLEADIREAGRVIEPALAMPDGLLLAGESRLLISQRLGLPRMPVQIVLSPLSPEEQERRLILSNLLRFEIGLDARALLMLKVWPGYVLGKNEGGPKRAEIAEALGVSERQVKREARIVREASAKAKEEGREVAVADVAEARERTNEARREKQKPAERRMDEEHDPAGPRGHWHSMPTGCSTTGALDPANGRPRTSGAGAESPAIVRVRYLIDRLDDEAASLEVGPVSEASAARAEALRYAADMIEEALR